MNLSRLLVTPLVSPFKICTRADNSLLFAGGSTPGVVDISKATKLKKIVIMCKRVGAKWVAAMLRSVTSNNRNLRQIILCVPDMCYCPILRPGDPSNVLDVLGETDLSHWLELDRALAQLWESHSIRPKVYYYASSGKDEREWDSCIHEVLPEITRRGIADLVAL